jgi:hypothetical protein
MFKDFKDFMGEIQQNNQNLFNSKQVQVDSFSKELDSIKTLLLRLDAKMNQIVAKLDEFTLMLHSDEDDTYEAEWTPYDEKNFSYEDDYEDDTDESV